MRLVVSGAAAKSRRDRIAELHNNDEGDAPVPAEDAQKSAERVERRANDHAALDSLVSA
jgi:hypothetical protein